jgi:hypothetical protein
LLSDGGHVQNGDEYKFRVHAESATYTYVLHRGSSGVWEVLFPQESSQSDPLVNPTETDKDLWVPAADRGFVIKGVSGTEATYVYSSREPDQGLEELMKKIRGGDNVKLLPPRLPEPQASVSITSVTTHGDRPQNAPARPPGPPPPTTIERSGKIEMKDLGPPKPGDSDSLMRGWSRLPPSPAAYIRFSH